MNIIKAILIFFTLGLSVYGQAVGVKANKIKGSATAPSGACSAQDVQLTTAGVLWTCAAGTWTSSGGGTTINSTNGALPYRVNGTTFGDSAFASNALNSTYLSATSGASGAGLTLAVAGGGSNEKLTLTPKGSEDVYITGAIRFSSDVAFSSGAGPRIYRSANNGLALQGYAAVVNNFALFTPAGAEVFSNPISTANLVLVAGGGLVGVNKASSLASQFDVLSTSNTRSAARFQAANGAASTQINIENRDGSGTLQGGFYASGVVLTGVFTVSGLPSAATVGQGSRAFVTDANATTFGTIVAGGGANKVPVYSDGTNWIIG